MLRTKAPPPSVVLPCNRESLFLVNPDIFNLKAAVGREKAVQAIDVHRECINCVVTFGVMNQFLHFLGAARGCADFRDPTAVFRFNRESIPIAVSDILYRESICALSRRRWIPATNWRG